MSSTVSARSVRATHASDGAGVKLRRSLGQTPDARVDPVLMLDGFSTDDPEDYIAGFPAHPRRGFETFTYMLEGHMQRQDHLVMNTARGDRAGDLRLPERMLRGVGRQEQGSHGEHRGHGVIRGGYRCR